jgi:peptidoglycan/LPS O-acetylase OafA/YrhL
MGCPERGARQPARGADPHMMRRLGYVDGLRGLVALYVVLLHGLMEIDFRLDGGGLPAPVLGAVRILLMPRIAVSAFIVLSGFCLMLPVVESGRLRGGLRAFVRRRARRILPAYYAALGLSLLVTVALQATSGIGGTRWAVTSPSFDPLMLVSHLVMLHNLSAFWSYGIDYPAWSIATEWQIYFAFALLLLPLWRRAGITVTVVVAFALGLAPHVLLNGAFDQAAPWYLGSFALGMLAAQVVGAEQGRWARLREALPWGTLAGCVLVPLVAALVLLPAAHSVRAVIQDPLASVGVASLLIAFARADLSSPLRRGLEGRRAAALGACSYSLYLTHAPVLAAMHAALRPLSLPPELTLLLLETAGTALAVAVAWRFSLLFERPLSGGALSRATRWRWRHAPLPVSPS